jgi:undecaprenyl-diphosphatase
MVDYLDDLELRVCLRVNALSRIMLLRRFFGRVSRLGDYPGWVILGVICAVGQGENAIPFVIHALATAGVGIVVYKALKKRLVRERPYVTHGEIVCGAAPLRFCTAPMSR